MAQSFPSVMKAKLSKKLSEPQAQETKEATPRHVVQIAQTRPKEEI